MTYTLHNRDLDIQCVRAMGYPEVEERDGMWMYEIGRGHLSWGAEKWVELPYYSTDRIAALTLEDWCVEHSGSSWSRYLRFLREIVGWNDARFINKQLTLIIRATPEQKAHAFVKAVPDYSESH